MRLHIGADDTGAFVAVSARGAVRRVERGDVREDLLPIIDRCLAALSAKTRQIREIAVDQGPGGFSAVRRRIAAASALSYALGIGILAVGRQGVETVAGLPASAFLVRSAIEPIYDGEPNITKSRRPTL
jgi:hypothetical protein